MINESQSNDPNLNCTNLDLNTIASLLQNASEESAMWPQLMFDGKQEPNKPEIQKKVAKLIKMYLYGYRLAHQNIITQLKVKYTSIIDKIKKYVENNEATNLEEYVKETLYLIPDIQPTQDLQQAIIELSKHRRRIEIYAIIAIQIAQQIQDDKIKLDHPIEEPVIIKIGNEDNVAETAQFDFIDDSDTKKDDKEKE